MIYGINQDELVCANILAIHIFFLLFETYNFYYLLLVKKDVEATDCIYLNSLLHYIKEINEYVSKFAM